MSNNLKNKRGGFTDLFLFIIFAFVIVTVLGILIYSFNITEDHLKETIGVMDLGDTQGNNASEVIDNTVGSANISFTALYWISVFLIFGMILAIFIGSYMVTTKPIFFIPYIFIWVIAIIVSVPLSNSYETISNDATLSSTYANFVGSNFILNNLPMIVAVVGIIGGIIMFTQMGKRQQYLGGVYG